jgi:hypothetical protein
MSFEKKAIDPFNAILFASIAELVVELQQMEKGTSKITNRSQAVIRLV